MSDKNPSSLYNDLYLQRPVSLDDPTLVKAEDNGVFYGTAVSVSRMAERSGAHSVLDVGCGRGFIVRHLRNLGLTADGCEYGEAALVDPILPILFGDLTGRLPYDDRSYDLVICTGVLSHIPEDMAAHAVAELCRVASKAIFTNTLNIYDSLQGHHLTFRPLGWWAERFLYAGWIEDEGERFRLLDSGLNRRPEQSAAIWKPGPWGNPSR